MSQFIKIGTTAELEDLEGGTSVQAGGRSIAVFNLGGVYYAIDENCPHRGGPLSEGRIAGEVVVCPWHGARFEIKTGAVVGPPAAVGVKSYPVRVNGGDVEVDVS